MTRIALTALAMGVTLTTTAHARRAAPRPQRPEMRFLEHTRDIVGAAHDANALATQLRASLEPPLGMTVVAPAGSAQIVTLRFGGPIPALEVARSLGWYGGYAISGDVHQTQWYFVTRTGDLGANRIATEAPHIGSWDVRIVLAGRPAGQLPVVVSGASPAYALSRYPADAVAIEYSPHQ